ncbi:unnamed protein product [Diatraea saccharalis]|uniref:Uncharacterized protein n=1 Tax=Diatraea saccharalis TaxID=40085 RepID=A0A9N9QVQ6_9NEOP|nr:unnamed protein product [Diatraea saccharalis]
MVHVAQDCGGGVCSLAEPATGLRFSEPCSGRAASRVASPAKLKYPRCHDFYHSHTVRNPAHLELLPPREGKITSAGDKEVDGASSAIVPESGVELCQVKRQIERPSLLRASLTNRHINCRRPNV